MIPLGGEFSASHFRKHYAFLTRMHADELAAVLLVDPDTLSDAKFADDLARGVWKQVKVFHHIRRLSRAAHDRGYYAMHGLREPSPPVASP